MSESGHGASFEVHCNSNSNVMLSRIWFRYPLRLHRALHRGYYLRQPLRLLFPSGRHIQSFSSPIRYFSVHNPCRSKQGQPPPSPKGSSAIRENIYTLPNLLTVSRIFACPVLGWSILENNFYLATSLLVYAGITDLVRISCY